MAFVTGFLIEKFTKGQALQLRLQSTVEGLLIAAISFYVIKALKVTCMPFQSEIVVGVLVPVFFWGAWQAVQRIHQKLYQVEP